MNYATKEKQTLTIVGVVSSTWKIVNMFLPLGILFFLKENWMSFKETPIF